MQEYFGDRRKQMLINGKTQEDVVLKRVGKMSKNIFAENYEFKVLCQDNTIIANGDIVTDGDTEYLVTVRRDSFLTKTARFRKCNNTISVSRLIPKYGKSMRLIGNAESLICTDVPVSCREITAKMRMFDAGLLDDTVMEILMPIKDIKLLDRITMNNKNFIVNNIDNIKYQGLLLLQCKEDERKCENKSEKY